MSISWARSRGFSLIELVIVVVIIGIIAAIAIPRMSRGATGAGESALTGDLALLRNAIDLYQVEHLGTFPDLVTAPGQLTQCTDEGGDVSASRDATHIYGPYLRDIPPLPVGADKGNRSFVAGYAAGNGWVYSNSTGAVATNTKPAETDSRGVPYSSY